MRSVSGTERKPTSVLSETAHRTEWMMTKTSEGVPSPNQISASGRSAIAGSGLNIAVSVVSSPEPRRVETATEVKNRREREPGAVAVGERFERGRDAVEEKPVRDVAQERRDHLREGRQEERVVEEAGVELPQSARPARMAPFWTASFLTIRSYQGSGRSTTTSPAGSTSSLSKSGRSTGRRASRGASAVMPAPPRPHARTGADGCASRSRRTRPRRRSRG